MKYHGNVNKGEPFGAKDLVGGDNREWEGTPLKVLWCKHVDAGKSGDEAFDEAAKDAGWLLKKVLAEDKMRTYTVNKEFRHKEYSWTSEDNRSEVDNDQPCTDRCVSFPGCEYRRE